MPEKDLLSLHRTPTNTPCLLKIQRLVKCQAWSVCWCAARGVVFWPEGGVLIAGLAGSLAPSLRAFFGKKWNPGEARKRRKCCVIGPICSGMRTRNSGSFRGSLRCDAVWWCGMVVRLWFLFSGGDKCQISQATGTKRVSTTHTTTPQPTHTNMYMHNIKVMPKIGSGF